jgi:O-antigen ligase
MPEYVRALGYVVLLTFPVFLLARRIAVPIVDEAEFKIWRNAWFATTCAVFLSGSFFVFAMMMLALSIYIHRHAKQPLLLYIVLMFAAPCVRMPVGIPGIFNYIIELSPPRLLCISILLPIGLRLLKLKENRTVFPLDLPLMGYVLVIFSLAVRSEDLNSMLRLQLAYILDIVIPYFVFSRALKSGREINQTLLAFAVGAMPLALIGSLEILKSWRVYHVVIVEWNVPQLTPYLFRDGLLRAAATSVEAIAFGFMCMTGAACVLILRSDQRLGLWRLMAFGLLFCGLLASVSRGPWLGFVLFCAVISMVRLRTSLKLGAACLPLFLIAALAVPQTVVDRFINLLPFVGKADVSSETYRSDLFENSLLVIERHPLFGSQQFLAQPEMQRMIQGQGIIDIVNSYLQVALEFGLVGLSLFILFFACNCLKLTILTFKFSWLSVNCAGVLALTLAMLFTIVTTSSVSTIPHIYWVFGALAVAISSTLTERAGSGVRVLGRGLGGQATGTVAPVPPMRILGQASPI